MAAEIAESALRIVGGRPLRGTVDISGAKNAAMPCLAAALLGDTPSQIERVPNIADVHGFCKMLRALGASAEHDPETSTVSVTVASAEHLANAAPDDLVKEQRASILLLGALLGRGLRHVESAPPGGDDIGARSLDILLDGLRKLGATVEETDAKRIIATTQQRLRGKRLFLDYPSVLATESLMLAAVLAEGRTQLINAAQEPEIACLADLLNAMGARIAGAGTSYITIDGVDRLKGVRRQLIPDRIEAGTLAIAVAISGGQATLRGVALDAMIGVSDKLEEIGVALDEADNTLTVRPASSPRAANIQTMPYPGFPTDLQAPLTALLTQADGASTVWERVFEDRMQHIDDLRRMGAKIALRNNRSLAQLRGPAPLTGCAVRGRDIRAVAALALAALAAEGESHVSGLQHLNRGYERFPDKLAALGAEIAHIP